MSEMASHTLSGVPENTTELMGKNSEQTTPVMLQMKKIIIADLEGGRPVGGKLKDMGGNVVGLKHQS